MLKLLLEVAEDTSDEDCDRLEMAVRAFLQSEARTLVLRGIRAHAFEFESKLGAQVEAQPKGNP